MHQLGSHSTDAARSAAARTIDALAWGLFFIWMGVAFLADVGWSTGVLGAGLVALGAQAARRFVGLAVDRFGFAMGLGMAAWGAWGLVGSRFGTPALRGGLLPLVFIALGGAMVLRALLRSTRADGGAAAQAHREQT